MEDMTDAPAPVFKTVFGADWEKLPRVFRRHYACRAGTNDSAACEGLMEIRTSWLGRLFSPLFYLSGTLVPYAGRDIRATVRFDSARRHSHDGIVFDRVFSFPGRKPYRFRSFMMQTGSRELTERTRLGIGWRADFLLDGNKIDMRHRGYSITVFGRRLPFPGEWLLGRGSASETALDDDRFAMTMDIVHPLFGRVFGYSGIFTMTKDANT